MTKYCPKCGAQNPDDAVYCIKCGYKFPLEASEQPANDQQKTAESAQNVTNQQAAQPSTTSQTYYCQECGQPVPHEYIYCPVCGSFKIAPYPPSYIPRPAGVTVLGIIQIIFSAISLWVGMTFLGMTLAPAGGVFAIVGIAFVVAGALSLIFAVAFLTGKNWGRILMMIGAIIELIDFPLGTVMGILILWYLTRPRVKAYFKQPK